MVTQKSFQETPHESEQRRLHHRAKLAVRDPAIATQELLKWHEKHTAGDPLISSREYAVSGRQIWLLAQLPFQSRNKAVLPP